MFCSRQWKLLLWIFGVLACINPYDRLPSIVKEFPCPVLAVLMVSGARARSSIPQPTRYLGCRGPSLRTADFANLPKSIAPNAFCAAIRLRVEDVESPKSKRERCKKATWIDKAHDGRRCALTVNVFFTQGKVSYLSFMCGTNGQCARRFLNAGDAVWRMALRILGS